MKKNIILFSLLISTLLSGSEFDNIFKIRKEIILEQNNKSFIGSVRNCYIDENNIIIADSKTSNVKIYNTAGKLLKIIGKKGRGPGEFQKPVGLDANDEFIFVSDIKSRRLNIFNRHNFDFIKSFTILDGRELKVRNNKIYLSYADHENNKSLHIYSLEGEKLNSYLEIPKITIENRLVSDLTTFDFDGEGNIYFVNEMSYEIFKGSDGVFRSFVKGGKGKYIAVPDKPFQNFYSKEQTLKWIHSWTHILKLSVNKKYEKLLIYMMQGEGQSMIDIYDLNGKPLSMSVETNMRLLCTDNKGYIYFLDEEISMDTIKFIIKQYEFR